LNNIFLLTCTFYLDGQLIGNGGFDELMLKHENFASLVAEASKQQQEEKEDELSTENNGNINRFLQL
jgi:hypothetical protein